MWFSLSTDFADRGDSNNDDDDIDGDDIDNKANDYSKQFYSTILFKRAHSPLHKAKMWPSTMKWVVMCQMAIFMFLSFL